MTCSACSTTVEKSVRKLQGIDNVTVSLLTNTMTVEYDGNEANPDTIITAVKRAGYGAALKSNAKNAGAVTKANPIEEELKEMKVRLIVSFIFPCTVIIYRHGAYV